jgi:hypothetical protein
MTYKEFQCRICIISQQKFRSMHFDPLQFGIERTRFEERQLMRMIEVASGINSDTAQRRVDAWKRQLDRIKTTRQRLENTKAGIFQTAQPANRTRRNASATA